MTANSFDARSVLSAGGRDHEIYRLDVLGDDAAALPYSLKVLLENLLRKEDGDTVTADDVRALVASQGDGAEREISFMPARVLMQDFTGVPAVVDLAARSEEHTSELQSLMRSSSAVLCLQNKNKNH